MPREKTIYVKGHYMTRLGVKSWVPAHYRKNGYENRHKFNIIPVEIEMAAKEAKKNTNKNRIDMTATRASDGSWVVCINNTNDNQMMHILAAIGLTQK